MEGQENEMIRNTVKSQGPYSRELLAIDALIHKKKQDMSVQEVVPEFKKA